MKLRLRLTFWILSVAALANAQSIPAEFRSLLSQQFRFSDDELRDVEAGRPAAKLIPTRRPDDMQMIGVVRVDVSSDQFIHAYRDIVRFENGKEVVRTGKFSNPPRESDLAGFQMPDLNDRKILACHPGSCDYKLPVAEMKDLQNNVNWSAPDRAEQANARVREAWIKYLNRYRAYGNSALAVYGDRPEPCSVAHDFQEIINGLDSARARIPDLIGYLEHYPKGRPPDTDDFFYWQEAEFGLKPVTRTSHVIIQKLPGTGDPTYVIASKMLSATHYFRAALELKAVVPVRLPSGQPAVYFVAYQRSFIDGMNGVGGVIVHHIVAGRAKASLEENLQLGKDQLENDNRRIALRQTKEPVLAR